MSLSLQRCLYDSNLSRRQRDEIALRFSQIRPMTNVLQLTLFGSPEVRYHDQPVTGFRSSKAQALLYYLAATGRPHTRPTLAGLFWGDQLEAAARTSLSKCLSNLRELVDDAVLVDRQTVAFNRQQPYHLDTEGFLVGIGQPPTPATIPTWQAALALYRGDFLEGFYVREAPDFEQWVLVQRAHYREAVLQGLHTLAHWHEQQGDLTAAITHTRRLLTLEPWREEAHRQLMRLLARSGQRAAALAQFEMCRRILDEELAVEPDAETVALLAQIKNNELHVVAQRASVEHFVNRKSAIVNPLPIPLTPLIGRERELAALGELLHNPQCRLITIIGAGGIGKTLLSVATATQQAARFADGVAFVPLAAITNATFLAHAILQALAQPLRGDDDPTNQLLDFLRSRQILLVLDNYEQLLPTVTLLYELLIQVVGLTLLVTSRERLALQAEQLFPLEGLPYPDPAGEDKLEEFAAFQLFWQRARQIKPSFVPTAQECVAIARICQISEGLPLAIELAAGALRTQSAVSIAAALAASQPLPTSRLRDLPARHLSITAVFEHSWRLLSAQEQGVLARLSVFRGGFVLEAAASVAGADTETLTTLVDKSLVRQQAEDRFDLHELLRHFALEKRHELDRAEQTAWQHLVYFLTLAEALEPRITGAPNAEAMAQLAREYDNFRAALDWGLASPSPAHPVAMAAAWLAARVGRFWHVGKHGQEGRIWLAKALALVETEMQRVHADGSAWSGDEKKLRAKLLFRAAILETNPALSRALLEQSLQHYRTLQDQRALARCLQELALAVSDLGELEQAKAYFTEGLDYARRINDPWCIARSLVGLGGLHMEENNPQVAAQLAEEALAIYRQQRDGNGTANAMIMLAQAHVALGHYVPAAVLMEEVHVLQRILYPESKGGPWAYRVHGFVEQMRGNYGRAIECYRRSLLLRQEKQQISGMAWALEGLVEVAVILGQAQRAAHLGGAAECLRQQVGSVITADDLPRYQQAIQQVCQELGEAKFQVAWSTGATLTLEQMVAYALADPPDT